jgi:hypothetical protein
VAASALCFGKFTRWLSLKNPGDRPSAEQLYANGGLVSMFGMVIALLLVVDWQRPKMAVAGPNGSFVLWQFDK